ncbi:hypothetical protein L1987_44261 [Smallanthus sonchifolius]|uniref:Uncharacterized protein n=1 Tax=Smallanthus sonchifolius TaxID=185202 RepID=A0ACB9GQ02_9ASTR|nr:hypothetical protein L1987_44261 [Smallanthus sonchifolius]
MPIRRTSSLSSNGIPIAGGTIVALSLLWAFWPINTFSFTSPTRTVSFSTGVNNFNIFSGDGADHGFNLTHDPPEPTFYDDPDLTYTIDKPIKNWDEKRREWLWLHPSFIQGLQKRVMLVTGSQFNPCPNPIGDHLLLRFFKNKVDYCRIHGYDIFYNNVLSTPRCLLTGPKSHKTVPESDDQTGLVYLLLKEKEKWGDKIYVEDGYYLEGYWKEIVGKLENITERYNGVEKGERRLRRRHAEKVRGYSALWEEYLEGEGWRRPFMTHFTGCQPCSGTHNKLYSRQSCLDAMEKVLNFADNQVLRSYGFMHSSLGDSGSVLPLPFDYPA